jgi:hypothetical protein
LCGTHGALVRDKRVHGGATLGVMVNPQPLDHCDKLKLKVVVEEDMVIDNATASVWKQTAEEEQSEGRVHGGSSLIALLSANSNWM